MPELAEVEFYRKRWSRGHGARVIAVKLHSSARVFRSCNTRQLASCLTGATLKDSRSAAKLMLFRFVGGGLPRRSAGWLGVHLGMSGELRVERPFAAPGRHDHLVLVQDQQALVFNDPRMFGRIRFSVGNAEPDWWSSLPPSILSNGFTVQKVGLLLQRRRRAPI